MTSDVSTRSPLKIPPLRYPGQSLDEELQRLLLDRCLPYFLVPPVLIAFALFEWYRSYRPSPPAPWLVTVAALVAVFVSIYKIRKIIPRIHALKLGRDGERVVGQTLEELRSGGAIVLHDIMADMFNVDHVAITPQGILVIETKTYSKPMGRDAKIIFDGENVSIAGRAPTRDPIRQARANTTWVHDLLKEMTGRSFPVRPVLLFPGWFVESIGVRVQDRVWVLNPKALPSFLAHEKSTLSLEEIKTATCHLSRYIRNFK